MPSKTAIQRKLFSEICLTPGTDVIETVLDTLKSEVGLEHAPHRSPLNRHLSVVGLRMFLFLPVASQQTSTTVASLMARFRSGDREAADQLFSLLYPELRRLAAIKMKAEGSQHSWQPSLLVNELYLQLIKVKSLPPPEAAERSERDQFLQFAAHVMRHLLIDHSRPLSHRITKIDIAKFETLEEGGDATLEEIDELLEKLASIHPRLRSVVEMKVFEGLSVDEIATRLGIAPRTVARNWTFCKEWLREKLQAG